MSGPHAHAHAPSRGQRSLRLALIITAAVLVVDVHDLHVWAITSGFISLSAHLKVRAGAAQKEILRQAHEALSSRFEVRHSTFQIESGADGTCATASCDAGPPTSS